MAAAIVVPSNRPERRARVLVAEDDTELRHMVATLLSADGYDVIEVEDGEQLLHYMGALPQDTDATDPAPDVIISDVCMPQFDGLQVLASLRDASVKIPVVLMTAFASDSICERAGELGAVTLLPKPFEIDDLRMIVMNLAERSRKLRQNSNGEKLAG